MDFKSKYEEYTEAEFLEFLEEFFNNHKGLDGDEYSAYINKLAQHFDSVTEHPEKNGVIFFPAEGVEDSPAGVLRTLKEWRAANGKPGFREV